MSKNKRIPGCTPLILTSFSRRTRRHTMKVSMTQFVQEGRVRLSSLIFIYHFWLFLFERTQTLPPAHHSTLRLHQVATDVVKALLLLGGPGKDGKGDLCWAQLLFDAGTRELLWTAEDFSDFKTTISSLNQINLFGKFMRDKDPTKQQHLHGLMLLKRWKDQRAELRSQRKPFKGQQMSLLPCPLITSYFCPCCQGAKHKPRADYRVVMWTREEPELHSTQPQKPSEQINAQTSLTQRENQRISGVDSRPRLRTTKESVEDMHTCARTLVVQLITDCCSFLNRLVCCLSIKSELVPGQAQQKE